MEIEEIAQRLARRDPARGGGAGGRACRRSRPARSPSAWGSTPAQVSRTVTTLLGCYRAFRDLDATMVEINPLVRHRRRPAAGARRQDDLRRQRAVPPAQRERAARLRRGGSARGAGRRARAQLRGAGRRDRLHHQRRRPRHGHHGHDQARRRRAGQLPRRRAAAPRPSGWRRPSAWCLPDPKVGAILVNIFAGINRCDWVAQGVVQAVKEVELKVPLVVRLAGTNVEEGRKILKDSGLPIITADSLAEAAEQGGGRLQGLGQARPRTGNDHEHPDRREDPRHRPGLHRGQGARSTPRR